MINILSSYYHYNIDGFSYFQVDSTTIFLFSLQQKLSDSYINIRPKTFFLVSPTYIRITKLLT